MVAVAAAVALLAGCGDDGKKLSDDDARILQAARERLDDAIDTEETLRTDPGEARRLVRGVRRALAVRGRRARLQRVEQLVPSLVIGRSETGGVTGLNEQAVRDFLRYARTDAPRALKGPARDEVATMVSTLDGKDRKAKIETLEDRTAEAYLREAASDVRPIWADLAGRLDRARDQLE